MSTRVPALALCGLLASCGPAAAPPPADPPATVASLQPAEPAEPEPADEVKPAPEPPLTQEEIELINTDPEMLSPEMRRKRAFALRRKILQNPNSPTARQLEALRLAAERGELNPQLPAIKTEKKKGITLHARNPGEPESPAPEK